MVYAYAMGVLAAVSCASFALIIEFYNTWSVVFATVVAFMVVIAGLANWVDERTNEIDSEIRRATEFCRDLAAICSHPPLMAVHAHEDLVAPKHAAEDDEDDDYMEVPPAAGYGKHCMRSLVRKSTLNESSLSTYNEGREGHAVHVISADVHASPGQGEQAVLDHYVRADLLPHDPGEQVGVHHSVRADLLPHDPGEQVGVHHYVRADLLPHDPGEQAVDPEHIGNENAVRCEGKNSDYIDLCHVK